MANRILIGNLGSTYGLKVSKDGVDVLTAADGQLMFDSSAANTRIIMTGSVSGTFDGFGRTNIANVEVQLPVLDYEPIVFTGFVTYVNPAVGGGFADERSNHKFATHWMGANPNLNPKDYTEFYWNPTTNRLKFNARSVSPDPMAINALMDFRYIVFSNRSN